MSTPDDHRPHDTRADVPAGRVNWPTVIFAAVIGLLVVVMVLLHLIGAVGPGAH